MAPEHSSDDAPFVSDLATIERVTAFVSARHHLSTTDAEDFASHVKLKLLENGCAILRKFQGRSSLCTYLTVVIQRLFLDYRVADWGRWRPSAEAKKAGEIGIVLEELLWRDGYAFDHACELILSTYDAAIDRAELERIAAALPARPRRRFEGDALLENRPADAPGADALAERGDRRAYAQRVSNALKRLVSRAEPQDRLILALRFEDGRTVAEIASMLQLAQKPLYRRLERLLDDLRAGLEADGIAASEVMSLLDDPAISIEWTD
jgi:RNA polymerase sigma factor (sigma-70 family)